MGNKKKASLLGPKKMGRPFGSYKKRVHGWRLKNLKKAQEKCAELREKRKQSNQMRPVLSSTNINGDFKYENYPLKELTEGGTVEGELPAAIVKQEEYQDPEDITDSYPLVKYEDEGSDEVTFPLSENSADQLKISDDEEEQPIKEVRIRRSTKRIEVGVTSKRKLKATATADKRRPSYHSPSYCFVCVAGSAKSLPKVTRTDCLSLMTEMLELSKHQANYYLEQLEEPEKWIGLCSQCLNVIREAVKLREQISTLEAELKKCQRQIVETMKETKLKAFRIIKKRHGVGSARRVQESAIESILNFVHHRKKHAKLRADVPYQNSGSPEKIKKLIKKVKSTTTGIPKLLTSWPPQSSPESPPPDNEIPIAIAMDMDLNGDAKDDTLLKDPLSIAEEIEEPDEKFQPPSPDRWPPVTLRIKIKSPLFSCALCPTSKFANEEQLQLHREKLHRSSPIPLSEPAAVPPNIVIKRRKKRRRKQNFFSSSEEEYEEEVPMDTNPTNPRLGIRMASEIQVPKEKEKDVSEIIETKGVEMSSEIQVEKEKDVNLSGIETEGVKENSRFGRYACPSCPYVKNYGVNRFAQHLAIHQRRPYKCTACSELLPPEADLQEKHWNENHSTIDISTSSTQPFERFLKMTLDAGRIWKCEACNAGFISEGARDTHELVKCTKAKNKTLQSFVFPYSCKTCKKPCRNFEEWRFHRVLHHPDVDRLSCLCCDLSFAEKTVEGVELRHTFKMVEHIKQDHQNEVTDSTLGRDREFEECEACGVVFTGPSAAQAHFREVHGIPSGGKIYFCPVLPCGKGFTGGSALRHHVNLAHLSRDPLVKKYACKYCEKRFTNSHKLHVHHEIHENKEAKPYQCELCGNSFAVKNYLYIHKRLSHEGRIFPSTNKKKTRVPKKSSRSGELNSSSATISENQNHEHRNNAECPSRIKSGQQQQQQEATPTGPLEDGGRGEHSLADNAESQPLVLPNIMETNHFSSEI